MQSSLRKTAISIASPKHPSTGQHQLLRGMIKQEMAKGQ
jgi:hypothetical protein